MIFTLLASLVLSFVLVPPKPAKAFLGVADEVHDPITEAMTGATASITSTLTTFDTALMPALKEAWNTLGRALFLNQLVDGILSWVQDTNAFIDDWSGYITDLVNRNVLKSLNNILISVLCPQIDDQLALDLQFIVTTPRLNFTCPAPEDPNQPFTWERWDNSLLTSGNYYLKLFSGLDEVALVAQDTREEENNKLISNQGAQGVKDKNGLTVTPGIVQAYAAQRASMMDLDYLLQSDDPMEFFSSVIDSYISRIAKQGLTNMATQFKNTIYSANEVLGNNPYQYGIKTDENGNLITNQNQGTYTPQGAPPDYSRDSLLSPEVKQIIQIKNDYPYFSDMVYRVPLVSEDYKKLLEEQKENLDILSQIKDTQSQIIDGINRLKSSTLTPPCALPAWANDYLANNTIQTIALQYDQLSQDIKKTEQNIANADQTATDIKNLVKLMKKAIDAYDAGDKTTLTETLKQINAISSSVMSELQNFAGTDETKAQDIMNALLYKASLETIKLQNDRPNLSNQLTTEKNYLSQVNQYINMCPSLRPSSSQNP